MDVREAHRLIEREFQRIGEGQPTPGLYLPIQYLLDRDGQRPMATLSMFAYALFSDDLERAASLGVGLEVFFEFVRMTEDLLGQRRRHDGEPAVHQRWDQNAVILSGDVMLIYSYKMIVESGLTRADALLRYTDACREVLESSYQLATAPSGEAEDRAGTEGSVARKRSRFVGLALELSAEHCGAPQTPRRLLGDLGRQIGPVLFRPSSRPPKEAEGDPEMVHRAFEGLDRLGLETGPLRAYVEGLFLPAG